MDRTENWRQCLPVSERAAGIENFSLFPYLYNYYLFFFLFAYEISVRTEKWLLMHMHAYGVQWTRAILIIYVWFMVHYGCSSVFNYWISYVFLYVFIYVWFLFYMFVPLHCELVGLLFRNTKQMLEKVCSCWPNHLGTGVCAWFGM